MAGNLISSNEIRTGDANRSAKINPVSDDGEESDLEEGGIKSYSPQIPSVQYIKKVAAELIGTFFLMFLGYASIVNDKKSDGSSTHLGVSLVWGLTLMVLIYSLGHISGGHFNPAVTLAFATVRRFPLKEVIGFMASQFVGSISAGFALRFLLGEEVQMAATVPTGSDMQSLLVEFLITFLLMFVICSVATDTRAIGELAGLAVGATIAVAVITVGPISGASLNPARTVGSALAGNIYTSIWIYFVGPIVGATAGAWSYDMLRLNDEPVRELTRSGSFLRSRRCF